MEVAEKAGLQPEGGREPLKVSEHGRARQAHVVSRRF